MARPDDITALQSLIETRVAAAERSLTTRIGGVALCQLQKSGRMSGSLKYSEGQLYALLAARRVVRSIEVANLPAAFEALATDWRQNLTAYQRQDHPPEYWIAYYQGGVDMLSTLLAADLTA